MKRILGRRYGKLVVIDTYIHHRTPCGAYKYRVVLRCDCGGKREVEMGQLNKIQGQACLRCVEGEAPAVFKSPLEGTWTSMQDRCYNPNSTPHKHYGGRGIGIFEGWRRTKGDPVASRAAFKAFCDYLGPKPSPDHSLDRINNDGHYEPGNVRWATADVQNANRRPGPPRPKAEPKPKPPKKPVDPANRKAAARRTADAKLAKMAARTAEWDDLEVEI